MILGDTCTRACGFCAVKTGRPTWFDADEPRRVAEAICALGLEHVVVTSVARDDLPDGGAGIFAATIRQMRATSPGMGIEVLIPDFDGSDTVSGPSWTPARTSSTTTSRRSADSRSPSASVPARIAA